MTGVLIGLACVLLLAFLPLGFKIRYDQSGAYLWLKIWFIPIAVYPKDKQEKKKKKEKRSSGVRKKDKKSGGNLTDFLPFAQIVLDFLSDFRKRIWLQNLEFVVTWADEDPCDLAIKYGNSWALLSSLMQVLEQYVNIKKRNVQIQCDFTAEQTIVFFRTDILISLGNLLYITLRHGFRGLRKYFKIINKTKAVQ